MINRYIIFGAMGSGKDTVARMLCSRKNIKSYNIGDSVRDISNIVKKYENLNDKNMIKDIKKLLNEYEDFIVTYFKGANIINFNSKNTLDDVINIINKNVENSSSERQLLHDLADMFRKYDKNIFNYITMGKILKDKNKNGCVVVGGRTFDDYNFYRKEYFRFIGIQCMGDYRRNRIVKRDGYFKIKETTHNTEVHVNRIIHLSDIVIDNSGSLRDLKLTVNKIE